MRSAQAATGVSLVLVVGSHWPSWDVAGHRRGEINVRALLTQLMAEHSAPDGLGPIVWLHTPMALGQARDLAARLVVYDGMDQLANFLHAPKALRARERALMGRADLVFRRRQLVRFTPKASPADLSVPEQRRQSTLRPSVRRHRRPVGHARHATAADRFFGVIDERLDLDLLRAATLARADWQWVMVGPVVKIDPSALPRLPNLHYLGSKPYGALPSYLGRWDVAVMPFAINPSTKFISPTKTPEYLAGGCPVVSTPVTDVVRACGKCESVYIALGADGFVAQVERALGMPARGKAVRAAAERALSGMSWDHTQASMAELMHKGTTGP